MSDLIDRQAAIDSFRYDDDGTAWNMDDIVYRLEQFPSVQPEPKKGKWTRPFPTRPKTYERFCSECKGKAWYCGTGDYNFCPNCGAVMKGE